MRVPTKQLAGVALTTLLATTAATTATAAPASPGPAASQPKLLLVGTADDSYRKLVDLAVARDANNRPLAQQLTHDMLQAAADGTDPHLPGPAQSLQDERLLLQQTVVDLATPQPARATTLEPPADPVAAADAVASDAGSAAADPSGAAEGSALAAADATAELSDPTLAAQRAIANGSTEAGDSGDGRPGDALVPTPTIGRASTSRTAAAPSARTSANPAQYPTSGSPIANNFAWQDTYGLVQYACSFFIFCDLTDSVTVRLTVNPGSITSRFDFTAFYVPNSGAFHNIFMSGVSLCGGGIECARTEFPQSGPMDGIGSGSAFLSQRSQGRGKLAHAFSLLAYDAATGGTRHRDDGRTGTARCVPLPLRTCQY